MNRVMMRLMLLGCVCYGTTVEAKSILKQEQRKSEVSSISTFSKLMCPKISGYAFGDVITNEVCTYRYRRFDRGLWTSETYWRVPLKNQIFGFTNDVKVVSDQDRNIIEFDLSNRITVNPKKEDVRKRLVEQLLRFQKIIICDGEFDNRLIGTNLIKSISMKGDRAYDIHQNLSFVDANAVLYASYRSHGSERSGSITVELRLRKHETQKMKNRDVSRCQYTLPKDKRVPIGSYDGFSLGQQLDSEKRRVVRKLDSTIWGCKEMRIGLSKKNRIWEIKFENTGKVLSEKPFDDLMQIFLGYQKCVVQHFNYPVELLDVANVYYNEEFNVREGWTKHYITQWIDCVGGNVQIVLNASNRDNGNIEWKIIIRAVNFKIDSEDEA